MPGLQQVDHKIRRAAQRERTAEARRKAFRRFMEKNELTPSEWARLAGLPTPNAIYNFLAGRAQSLSIDTSRRLADALGVLVSDIFGETEQKAPREPEIVTPKYDRVSLKSIAKAGLWRRTYEIPGADQIEIAVVQPSEIKVDEAVRVEDNSCNALFPPGTYAMVSRTTAPRIGDAVVVQRSRTKGAITEHEITIREVQADGDGAKLVWRSFAPEYQGSMPIPWPYHGEAFERQVPEDKKPWRYSYRLLGVVVLAQMAARLDAP